MRSLLIFFSLALCCTMHAAHAGDAPEPSIEQGIANCSKGNYHLALDALQAAYRQHPPGLARAKAAGALGQTYLQMRRAAQAEPLLREAYAMAEDPAERARHGIDLANLHAGRGQIDDAKRLYGEALKLAPGDASVAISAGLNLASLSDKALRLGQLIMLADDLPRIKDQRDRARFTINLGIQAKTSGAKGLQLAYQSFEAARILADQIKDARLRAEALDQLAQLYEDQQRNADALHLSEQGVMVLQTIDAHDLSINLEWRRGRMLRKLGKPDLAIAAYQRAVDHIEAIRQDIPVEYQDGRSSFRETLEPVYLGLADLLLQQSATLGGKEQLAQLRRARNTVELIKQTELEDFLGDRCTIDSIRVSIRSGMTDVPIAFGTAVLYPIILPDRLELLLETSTGMERRTAPIPAAELRRNVLSFAAALRSNKPYEALAKQLYGSLLQPMDGVLQRERIDTLVVVPDGILRILPFSALHDGRRFAIQKYAIAVAPGLSMTNTQTGKDGGRVLKTLLAGMSEPGAVVEKLPESMVELLLESDNASVDEAPQPSARAIFTRTLKMRAASSANSASASSDTAADKQQRNQRLKKILALSGVKEEIELLGKLGQSRILLNQDFSRQAFSEQVKTGDYRIIHIASHGVFGGTADTTFIMAHDELITIDKLQDFLRSTGPREQAIELLTLSACETAEGDDRAPLGLSGAALKARAKSALGSLWPVSDDATKLLMGEFYKYMAQPGMGKAKALQRAQWQMIENKTLQHPFFWAPFVMIGSWL